MGKGGKWERGGMGEGGLGDRHVYGRGSYMQERDKQEEVYRKVR